MIKVPKYKKALHAGILFNSIALDPNRYPQALKHTLLPTTCL